MKSGSGFAGIWFLLYILLFLIIIFSGDVAFIYLSQRCFDTPIWECLTEDSEDVEEKNTVEAKGSFSYKNYGINLYLTIPLEGGAVTGRFEGDCSGSIKANYDGKEGGVISGDGRGSCALVLPASGSFSGTVNQQTKTVPISGSGNAAGISGEGSLTLSF